MLFKTVLITWMLRVLIKAKPGMKSKLNSAKTFICVNRTQVLLYDIIINNYMFTSTNCFVYYNNNPAHSTGCIEPRFYYELNFVKECLVIITWLLIILFYIYC